MYDAIKIGEEKRELINRISKDLSTLANGFSDKVASGRMIGEKILKDHRTLQQSTIGILLNAIIRFSEVDKTWTDPRNEYAYEVANKIREFLEKEDLIYQGKVSFPLI